MTMNKKVRQVATLGLGLMAVAALVLAFHPSEASAGKKKKLPPVDEQSTNCGSGAELDTDCDGLTDAEEITGAGVTKGGFPGSDESGSVDRADRLDENSPDLFVIVSRPQKLTSKLPADALQTARAALGATITIHEIDKGDATFNRKTGQFFVTDTVRAVRLAESQNTDGVALGVCSQGTVSIGPSTCVIFTARIEDFVTQKYAEAGDGDTGKRDADILKYTLWVAAHEIFHGGINLRRESVADYAGHHYATKDEVVESQTVLGVKSTGTMTFFIGETLKAADLDPSTGYQLR